MNISMRARIESISQVAGEHQRMYELGSNGPIEIRPMSDPVMTIKLTSIESPEEEMTITLPFRNYPSDMAATRDMLGHDLQVHIDINPVWQNADVHIYVEENKEPDSGISRKLVMEDENEHKI